MHVHWNSDLVQWHLTEKKNLNENQWFMQWSSIIMEIWKKRTQILLRTKWIDM